MSVRLEHSKVKAKQREYIIKKLTKYIKRDKFKRLKLFLIENKIHPDSVIGRHQRTSLHECARNGSIDSMRILLECDADPNVKDTKGNYPLHLAIKYCLKQKPFNTATTSELVDPLKINMHERIHEENKSGTTCWQLLQGLSLKKELANNEVSSSSSETSHDSDFGNSNNETEWNEKVTQIGEEDHFFHFGKFEDQKQFYNKFKETYDQWADRIYNEYNKRHKKERPPTPQKTKVEDKCSEFQNVKLPPFKPIYPSVLLLNETSKSVEKYKKLFSMEGCINKKDLPFSESSTAEEIISLILRCDDSSEQKKILREGIRRWHPDKFSQIFNGRIKKCDEDDVMKIVTHVSQILLVYGK